LKKNIWAENYLLKEAKLQKIGAIRDADIWFLGAIFFKQMIKNHEQKTNEWPPFFMI